MERKPVQSSNVKAVGYDKYKRIIEIEFLNGDIYQYMQVPEEVYERFIKSSSIGKAVHSMLKGKYSFIKVEGR